MYFMGIPFPLFTLFMNYFRVVLSIIDDCLQKDIKPSLKNDFDVTYEQAISSQPSSRSMPGFSSLAKLFKEESFFKSYIMAGSETTGIVVSVFLLGEIYRRASIIITHVLVAALALALVSINNIFTGNKKF